MTASRPVWNGPFQTWHAACGAATQQNAADTAFSSERWLRRIADQLIEYRKESLRFGIAQPPRPCNLPWVCALVSPSSIIDFGGSSGWAWDYLKDTVPGQNVSTYAIVELEAVVRYLQDSKLHDNVISYHLLEGPLEPCDLLYSNSVLQYFESNQQLLSLVARTVPEYVFLEDIYAKGEDDFFGTQNYYGQAIPSRFPGLGKLRKELSCMGYHELAHCPYAAPIHGVMKPLPMENFPEPNQLRYSLSVLFKKAPT